MKPDRRIVSRLLAAVALAGPLAGTVPAKGGGSVATGPQAADLDRVVEGNTRFAFDLYRRLKGGPGNLFHSPYSISTALAMTLSGAREDTARQMAETLHFELPGPRLHAAFRELIERLDDASPKLGAANGARVCELVTANALWGDQSDTFLPTFLSLTRDQYGAGLRQVDFRNAPDAARRSINAWVEERTREKVRELLGPGDVDSRTSLVLTNAIYFKSAWANPFSPSATQPHGVFRLPVGGTATVPLMRQTQSFAYLDGGGFQLVELPYVGGSLSMVVLLPRDVEGLPALEQGLTPEALADWLGRASRTRVELTLPRFKLTRPLGLAAVLAEMGMPAAFDPSRADFSGMNGRRDLSISRVLHKAHVDVNEQGTEAAAATGVMMSRASAFIPTPPVVFRADHPFVFLIRDRATGSVLFMGRLIDPRD